MIAAVGFKYTFGCNKVNQRHYLTSGIETYNDNRISIEHSIYVFQKNQVETTRSNPFLGLPRSNKRGSLDPRYNLSDLSGFGDGP